MTVDSFFLFDARTDTTDVHSAHICYTHSLTNKTKKNQLLFYDQVDENKLQIYKIGSVSDTRIPTRALFCILFELK